MISELANPEKYQSDLNVDGIPLSRLTHFYQQLVLIRACETKLAEAKQSGNIKGPVHLGAGQEAIAVGLADHFYAQMLHSAHTDHTRIFLP